MDIFPLLDVLIINLEIDVPQSLSCFTIVTRIDFKSVQFKRLLFTFGIALRSYNESNIELF